MPIYILLLLTIATVRERVRALRGAPERGAGGNTLEILLLAIGGVVVAGVVVAAVATAINSRTSQLNP